MSQENVDLVQRIYDAWKSEESARDFIVQLQIGRIVDAGGDDVVVLA